MIYFGELVGYMKPFSPGDIIEYRFKTASNSPVWIKILDDYKTEYLMDVEDWLTANGYITPLTEEQITHFMLTFG